MENLLKRKKSSVTASTDSFEKREEGGNAHVEKNAYAEGGSFTKIAVSDPPPKKKKSRRRLFIVGGVFLLVILLIVGLGILPAQAAYREARVLITSAQELASALKNQNLEEAKTKLSETRTQLQKTQAAWNAIILLKYIPGLHLYHQDGVHGLNAATHGLDALETSIAAIEPYADLLGLKAGSSFVAGSADERIQLAVKTMAKLTPKIGEIAQSVEKLKTEIDSIDPNRYPEKIGDREVRARLIEGKNLVNETSGLFLNAQPLLEVLPQLLGEPEPKRYLVLFQNDKELRPTGGFLTAYAHFRVEQGKFIVEKSEDIYELDNQITKKRAAPEEILIYHKGVYYFNIRDSNVSPDFLVSMQQFIDLYPGEFNFDGIIALDTHVLVEAVKILGEFPIAGRTFSAEIDKRCDCPKVIYELEDYATRPVAYVRETRKDIIGALMLEIMKRALGVSPSQYWGQLFQMGLTEINEKHILAYMSDEKTQKGIESLNMGGRIADNSSILGYKDGQNWDYLHINDANMAGAKSNLFMEHTIREEYAVAGDGSITKTLTIDYKNPAPPSNCDLEAGELCLNGLLRNWVRIYVPKGSELIESKGSQSPKDESAEELKTREDLGKMVFEGFLIVRPLGSAQLTLTYKLPFKKEGDTLHVLLQKQAGTEGHEHTIIVNGKQKEKFNLITDKVITVPL